MSKSKIVLKRVLSLLLAILLTLAIIPIGVVKSEAATVTLAQLQAKYPHGKYWNGGNANSYTSSPCTHHGSCSYNGSCGCNSFKGHAIQCMGFAYQLAYLVYGGDPYADWKTNKNVSALDSLKAGDVVRYKNNGHSIFVTGVSGNTVTYADCNSDGHCIIRWNQTISKSTLKSTFSYVDPAPTEWKPNPVSHKIDSNFGKNFIAYPKAKITAANIFDENHNQISSTAWIGTSDKCTINEVYTDGCCKVTYPLSSGGTKTAYSKISLFRTPNLSVYYNVNGGKINSDEYKVSNNLVYKGNTKFAQVWSYNQTQQNGLYNAATFGLTREGYTFNGWGTAAGGGTVFNQDDTKLTPSKINSNLKNGDCSTTLYAQWIPNTLNVYYNVNGGKINSDTYKSSNNLVYKGNTKFAQTWTYNTAQKNGLWNASSFGLTRDGYRFKGWGTTASGGTIFDQNDSALLPTKINSAIKNGNCSITLYAIWEKIPATVSSISIQSKPTKTVYTVGEKFDISGLAIKVSMSDGTTKTLSSGFTVSNPDMSTAGTKTVTVTYSGKTTSFTITVNNPPATISSISVQSKPSKTVYTVGEKFDTSGLSIKVMMSDGTTKTLTSGFTVSGPDMSTAGTKTVTVTYSGKTTTFTITVNAVSPPVNVAALRLNLPSGARIGQKVQIPVELDKATLGTLTFTVKYDSTKLKYVSCSDSAFDMCDVYAGSKNMIKAACVSNGSVPAGRIAVLTFEVIAPTVGSTELVLSVEEAYDGNDSIVKMVGGTWNLPIIKTILGDLNNDGKVTAIDARWALQAASGARELTDAQKAAADVNGDGKVTAIDARWILQAASGSRVL